jgi:Coenzyme PQQ synthesis protein D (PqqD)
VFKKNRKEDRGEQRNLLDIKPVRNLEWETEQNGTVVLLVPKFKNRYIVKYILPNLRKQYFRVKLDEYGSFVWTLLDGNTMVGDISEKLKGVYGENFDPRYERIGKFIANLAHNKFLLI